MAHKGKTVLSVEDVLAAIESESDDDIMANDSETSLESEEEVDKSTEDICQLQRRNEKASSVSAKINSHNFFKIFNLLMIYSCCDHWNSDSAASSNAL